MIKVNTPISKADYYGIIDAVEKGESGFSVIIDCVESESFDNRYIKNNGSILELITKIPNLLIKVDLSPNEFKTFLGIGNISKLEGRWLKVFKSKNRISKIYKSKSISNYSNNVPLIEDSNYSFQLINGRKGNDRTLLNWLRGGFNLGVSCAEYVKQEEALLKLDSIDFGGHQSLNLITYNVGQGNACCVNNGDFPLFYFDIGGGANFNHFTYPVPRVFNHSPYNIIVLSHWDEDHYETARRSYYLQSEFTFIAPVQHVTPRNLKFIAELISHGANLLLLPRTFVSHTFSVGTLKRCIGNNYSKNNCGLALHLKFQKEDDISSVLLPGDAQYKYIPNIQNEEFDGLIASHHGGRLTLPRTMPNTLVENGCIVYSYGDNNIYGHALQNTITCHELNYWGNNAGQSVNRRDTLDGDVLMSYFANDGNCCVNEANKLTNHFPKNSSIETQPK